MTETRRTKTRSKPQDQRTERYQIRHSKNDMKHWRTEAGKLGIDVSDFLRMAAARFSGIAAEVTPVTANTVTIGGAS